MISRADESKIIAAIIRQTGSGVKNCPAHLLPRSSSENTPPKSEIKAWQLLVNCARDPREDIPNSCSRIMTASAHECTGPASGCKRTPHAKSVCPP
jgi:hypothetical protein